MPDDIHDTAVPQALPDASGDGESLEQANVRLALVCRIAASIGSSLGMDGVIDLAVRSLAEAFSELRVSYSTVDTESRATVVRSIDPEGMPVHEATTWELADATEYLAAIRRQEIVVSEDVTRDPRMTKLGEIMARGGVRALVTAALPEAVGVTGLLSFNAPQARAWSEHELATLTDAAAYLFLAIQEARHELERAEAEEALRRRAELETFLVGLSTEFINMPAARIDSSLGEVLPDLARAADADAVLVFLFSADRSELINTFEWLAPEVGPDKERPASLATWEMPGLMKTLARLEPFCASSPTDLPIEERAERSHFEHYGLRSLLGIPVSTGGELLGFVGLVQLLSDRGWRDEAVAVLRVVGDIFGGALDRKRSEESLEAARSQLEASNQELERSNRAMALLNELGDLLQSCGSLREAGGVFDDFMPQLFTGTAGAVYHFSSSHSMLDTASSWGGPLADDGPFGTEDCWALRRGRPHAVQAMEGGLVCPHVGEADPLGTICLPLMAQGESLGMLHLRGRDQALGDDALRLALSAAEHLALGLANLRLRERLRSQALRDPLTGLVNQAYLKDQLVREVHRAHRLELPLVLMLLSLDSIDGVVESGDLGGERVLAALGEVLLETRPTETLVARLEGARVAVLLPEHGIEDARRMFELVAGTMKSLRLPFGRRRILGGTLSAGVATLSGGVGDAEGLLAAAKAALARARNQGGGAFVEVVEPARPMPVRQPIDSRAIR